MAHQFIIGVKQKSGNMFLFTPYTRDVTMLLQIASLKKNFISWIFKSALCLHWEGSEEVVIH